MASAPGKVLLAGGYLVLDRKYTGLVFGLSARIHVVVQRNEEELVIVRSPQFKEAEWRYKITSLKNGVAIDVKQMEDRYVQYLPYSQFLILGHGFMKCQESSCLHRSCECQFMLHVLLNVTAPVKSVSDRTLK